VKDGPHEAARAFHAFGSQIVVLGRGLELGRAMVALGQQLRKVTPEQLTDANLRVLRKPLDELRGLVDALDAASQTLRALHDGLTAIVGVDN
jgi:hypothetical protein